jgi:hypothetical protein
VSEDTTIIERIRARRMARLKQRARLQQRVLSRMLQKSIEPPARPARPHLKIVK